MVTKESYVRYATARGTLPLLLSGETLHWDGISAVTRYWRPPEGTVPTPSLHCPWLVPMGTRGPGHASPTPAIKWDGEAAPMTLYLAPMLLTNAAHGVIAGVIGTLVWLRQEGQEALLSCGEP